MIVSQHFSPCHLHLLSKWTVYKDVNPVSPPTLPEWFLQYDLTTPPSERCSLHSQPSVTLACDLFGHTKWQTESGRLWRHPLRVLATPLLALSAAGDICVKKSELASPEVWDHLVTETQPRASISARVQVPLQIIPLLLSYHFAWDQMSWAQVANPQNGQLMSNCGFQPLGFAETCSIETNSWYNTALGTMASSQICKQARLCSNWGPLNWLFPPSGMLSPNESSVFLALSCSLVVYSSLFSCETSPDPLSRTAILSPDTFFFLPDPHDPCGTYHTQRSSTYLTTWVFFSVSCSGMGAPWGQLPLVWS